MNRIYLDHAATTPLRTEVRDAMLPWLGERFGNPSSTHAWGREARNALEEARERVAGALGARRREIIFTSGGTEADNIAVLGRYRTCRYDAPGPIVISAIEHKAVSGAAQQACAEGAHITVLGVDGEGRVDLDALEESLRDRPCVVSVMWGSNEVGTLQPIDRIGARCREAGVVLHTDAVQAFGKVRLRVDETPCDLLALSAHKIGGPNGIGILYLREDVSVLPIAHGGGQERKLRPGTESVASAVGLATAAELAAAEQEAEQIRLTALRDRLCQGLLRRIPDLLVHGDGAERLPHILGVTLRGADAEALLVRLDLEGLAVSGGSACQSGQVTPSPVLLAMGRYEPGHAAVRFSFGHTSTQAEVDRAVEVFTGIVDEVRVGVGA